MKKRSQRRAGFTLVELIMVAVILAILAVVVIPQFSDASSDVKNSALRATLHTIRSQLELYKAQHLGKYPLKASWSDAMLKKTKDDGSVAADGKFGPYLQQMPVNPMDNLSTMAGSQDASGGWSYDETTGALKSNDSSVKDADSKTKDL
jgi:general secretion pathway protein G